MEQISYNKIVLTLQRGSQHVRELSRRLKTNSMSISRYCKALVRANVVDHRQEGKNKVYFLKKTIEAEEQAYIAEHYALVKAIEEYPILRTIVRGIKHNDEVKLAVLFGSYAKGLAHKGSDIDLFIEAANIGLKKEIEQLNTKISLKTGAFDENNMLIKEIKKDHIIIKGVELFYEKSKFFG